MIGNTSEIGKSSRPFSADHLVHTDSEKVEADRQVCHPDPCVSHPAEETFLFVITGNRGPLTVDKGP